MNVCVPMDTGPGKRPGFLDWGTESPRIPSGVQRGMGGIAWGYCGSPPFQGFGGLPQSMGEMSEMRILTAVAGAAGKQMCPLVERKDQNTHG